MFEITKSLTFKKQRHFEWLFLKVIILKKSRDFWNTSDRSHLKTCQLNNNFSLNETPAAYLNSKMIYKNS